MTEAWTPWIGTIDILRHLRARVHWGILIWIAALALGMAPDFHSPRIPARGPLMIAMVGGVGASLAMTWRLHERHQWAGALPYGIASVGVLAVLVPLTLLAHWIWGFASPQAFGWFLAMAVVGVLLRGVGATTWMARYRRS